MIKYLVISGKVFSKYDGDIHYISCAELTRLYGVNPIECIFEDENDPILETDMYKGLRKLTPRYDGNYRL